MPEEGEYLQTKNLSSVLKRAFKCRCSSTGNSLPGQQSLYSEPDPGHSGLHTYFPAVLQRSSAQQEAEKLRLEVCPSHFS